MMLIQKLTTYLVVFWYVELDSDTKMLQSGEFLDVFMEVDFLDLPPAAITLINAAFTTFH